MPKDHEVCPSFLLFAVLGENGVEQQPTALASAVPRAAQKHSRASSLISDVSVNGGTCIGDVHVPLEEQPLGDVYEPAPGESSVQAFLAQFCTEELLTGQHVCVCVCVCVWLCGCSEDEPLSPLLFSLTTVARPFIPPSLQGKICLSAMSAGAVPTNAHKCKMKRISTMKRVSTVMC